MSITDVAVFSLIGLPLLGAGLGLMFSLCGLVMTKLMDRWKF